MEQEERLLKSNSVMQKESLRIQKAEWVEQQIEKQRAVEDEIREKMLQEQEILENKSKSMTEGINWTKEMRRYNEDCREDLNAQVYALHGLTEDKLQGMQECRNSYFKGCALAFFLLSIALIGVCGWLHGFDSQIRLFMIAGSGIEGALLSQESRRGKFMEALCRMFYLLSCPAMCAVFVCYELHFTEYKLLVTISAMAGSVFLIIGVGAYFIYDPYRKERRNARAANGSLREIEQIARKTIRKNQKYRLKEEALMERRKKKEDRQAAKLRQKEEQKRAKLQEREEKRLGKELKREVERQARAEKRKEKKQRRRQEISEFAAFFRGLIRKKEIQTGAGLPAMPQNVNVPETPEIPQNATEPNQL